LPVSSGSRAVIVDDGGLVKLSVNDPPGAIENPLRFVENVAVGVT
jgi:hypothetical protein